MPTELTEHSPTDAAAGRRLVQVEVDRLRRGASSPPWLEYTHAIEQAVLDLLSDWPSDAVKVAA